MVATQKITNTPLPDNWKKQDSAYTGDDLIDAYLKGKEDGKNDVYKVLFNQLKNNISQATTVAEVLYQHSLEQKIPLKTIHIKADSIARFEALFIVQEDDFISDKFRSIYTYARGLKNKFDSENFYISFSFMPNSKNLNEKCLASDGFFLKYDKE